MSTNPTMGPNDFLQVLSTGLFAGKLVAKLIEIHGYSLSGGCPIKKVAAYVTPTFFWWIDLFVYAICLMTNHVHLVIDSGATSENIGELMKRVAGRQTRYVNRMEGRSRCLWEGRLNSSPIHSDVYLLVSCRYIELSPVVAGMCSHHADCRWLDFDPNYLGLGKNAPDRQRRYGDFSSRGFWGREGNNSSGRPAWTANREKAFC